MRPRLRIPTLKNRPKAKLQPQRIRAWIVNLLIVLIAAGGGWLAWPKVETLKIGQKFERNVQLKEGLDLAGGVRLVYEVTKENPSNDELDSLIQVLRQRVDGLGVSEPELRLTSLAGTNGVIVELPGVSDVSRAKSIIGSTGELKFYTEDGTEVLSGKDIKPSGASAQPVTSAQSQLFAEGFAQQNKQWEVLLKLNDEGKDKFAKATTDNVGKRIFITLDNQILSYPTVNEPITGGEAVINGMPDAQTARDLALSINYGALPVNIKLASEQTVGASLGNDAIARSLFAAVAGITLLAVFLIGSYGIAGIVASLALVLYAVLTVALFKYLGVTITLAGIAAFVISLGVAVDTNILTFERLREELRLGKNMQIALHEAFLRAWPSIRDSHASTLISSVIIFSFGSGSVRGFALILGLGALISLFTAVTVIRTWLLLISRGRLGKLLAAL